jgi:hypothetical protein
MRLSFEIRKPKGKKKPIIKKLNETANKGRAQAILDAERRALNMKGQAQNHIK